MKAQLLPGKHHCAVKVTEDNGKTKIVPLDEWNKKLSEPIIPPKGW